MKITKLPLIGLSAFLSSVSIGMAQLGFIFLLKLHFKATAAQIGIFGATWSIFYFISCIIFPRITRSLKPRYSLLIMLLGSALLFFVYLLKPTLEGTFLVYACFGVLTAFYWPPLMSWLSKGYGVTELARANGVFNFAWSLGGVLSAYIAGLLSETSRFLPIIVAASLFALNAALILSSFLMLKDENQTEEKQEKAKLSFNQQQNPNRIPAWLSNTLSYLVMGVLFNIFPIFAKDSLNFSESTVGLILSVRALATMVGFIILGRMHFWHFKSWLIPAAAAMMTLSIIVLAMTHSSVILAVCFVFIGLSMASTYTASLFYSTVNSSNKDAMVTIHESLLTFGQVVGSSLGGFIYMRSSFSAILFIFSAIIVVSILLQIFYFSKIKVR